MFRSIALLATFVLLGTSAASGIVIEQLNEALSTTPDNDYWTYNPDNGAITIHAASATETYVFWAHENGNPDTLASIDEIKRGPNLTTGTIKVRVSKSLTSLVPGATDIGAITVDTANITSIIEGIEITGNLLDPQAVESRVDQVTGPIEVGGSLLNAMTVNEDLEGALTIEGAIETGADVEILGDIVEPISIGTYIPNRPACLRASIDPIKT